MKLKFFLPALMLFTCICGNFVMADPVKQKAVQTKKVKKKMNKVEIYSTKTCPYCVKAKAVLKNKNIAFTEYLVDQDSSKLTEMLSRSHGKRTVPQIFIGDVHVGGFSELSALSQVELDKLLGK